MSKTLEEKTFNELYNIFIETNNKIKTIKNDKNIEKPVDIDIIKTIKAMFYQESLEVFKKYKNKKRKVKENGEV